MNPLRILVVDDYAAAADVVAETLRLNGHEARVAYDGPSALRAVADFRPEVVLLDLEVAGGPDGSEAARRLGQEAGGQDARVIGCTGTPQGECGPRASQAGFDLLLRKPLPFDRLEALLAARGAAAPQAPPPPP